MVINIKNLLEDKVMLEDFESFRRFGKMDAFAFTYYCKNHPEDSLRTERYFDRCSINYRSKVIKWINRWNCYEEN